MIGVCGHRAARGEVCERCATPHPRHVGGSANTGLPVLLSIDEVLERLDITRAELYALADDDLDGPGHYCPLCGMSVGHWAGCGQGIVQWTQTGYPGEWISTDGRVRYDEPGGAA